MYANSYGPKVLGPVTGLLGWSGTLVVVALIRALTGVGEGMLVVAVVGGKGIHGNEPPSALQRTLRTAAAVTVTALPALLIAEAA